MVCYLAKGIWSESFGLVPFQNAEEKRKEKKKKEKKRKEKKEKKGGGKKAP